MSAKFIVLHSTSNNTGESLKAIKTVHMPRVNHVKYKL